MYYLSKNAAIFDFSSLYRLVLLNTIIFSFLKELGNTQELQSMLSDLLDQVETFDRNDVESNLACLEKCRKLLHCNHHLMTELRTRIIPIICRTANSTHDDFSEEVILKKRQFCKENLAVLDVITPGYTTHRGGVLFELAECEFTLCKKGLECGKISQKEFLERLKHIKSILLECTQCLSNERPTSIEQYYEKCATVRLKDIVDYLIMFNV